MRKKKERAFVRAAAWPTLRVLCVVLGALGIFTPRTASGASGAQRATFVLVVTNNRSAGLARPDLHYADDDGAKYYEMFRMIAPEENTFLLTRLDRDTEKLFPHLRSKALPPEKARVEGAAREIARKAREHLAAGRSVDFFFVFAGHGDVDGGRGFLELADGPFTSTDLDALLKSIPATRAHVILDSCNSFFVLQPRKPGGRHFATSEDAAKTLSQRLPNVGVFLSTSAEADVFEWSELQSGIFSHAVRSGLSGAADANRDGVISYSELRAFVNIASAEVKNPLYRPKVFARGPGGRDGEGILDVGRAEGEKITLEAAPARRLTVRDADDLPWIDLHKEAGSPVSVRLPPRLGAHAVIEESELTAGGGRVKKRYTVDRFDGEASGEVAALTPTGTEVDARGPSDMFRMLFARPFGAHAYAQYERTEKQAPDVFGIATDDRERMRLMLAQVSEMGKQKRLLTGFIGIGFGAGVATAGGLMIANADEARYPGYTRFAGYMFVGSAGLSLAIGGLSFLSRSPGEALYEDFALGLRRNPMNPQWVIACTERKLLNMARYARFERLLLGAATLGVGITGGGVVVSNEFLDKPNEAVRMTSWVFPSLTVLGLGMFFVRTEMERVADLWANDPGLQRMPRLTITPTVASVPGGAVLGLGGSF